MIKEGDLVASFPGVTHKYDKSKFCLIFEKVFFRRTNLTVAVVSKTLILGQLYWLS